MNRPRVRFFATQPHYAQHLFPIHEALGHRARSYLWSNAECLPDDGTPVVIAGQADLAMVPGSCPVALVSHGIDQTYRDVDHGSYAGGRNRERISLFLCPNQRSVDLNLARYPQAQAAAIGSPRVESLAQELRKLGSPLVGVGVSALGGGHSRQEQTYGLASVPTVVLAWHWDLGICPETMSAWPYYRTVIERLAGEVRFVGHGHPRNERLAREYYEAGVEWEPDQARAFARADLVCFDNTSAGYEAAALGIPVLALDAPGYRAEVDHGLRFWDQVPGLRLMSHRAQRPEMGPVAFHWGRDALGDALALALEDAPWLADHRAAVTAEVYGPVDGPAAVRAAEAILAWA